MTLYTRHEIACIIADLLGDTCACNYNGNDEWLPYHCDFAETVCPNVVGVACWEQYLKHIDRKEVSRMNRKEAIERIQEVMTIIRTQHMCKDIDGECTEEDRKAYIQRFEALRMAIEALQEPERKKGQWIILSSNEDSTVCKCSVCGEDFVFYQGEYFPNYCGDCGSDMKEVRQNESRNRQEF